MLVAVDYRRKGIRRSRRGKGEKRIKTHSNFRTRRHARQERRLVRQVLNTKTLQTRHTQVSSHRTRSTASSAALPQHLRVHSRQSECRNVRNDDERPREDDLVTGFGALDDLGAENNVETARHGTGRDLVRVLLDADLLPVGEFGLLDVELPSGAIRAGRVGADGGLRGKKGMSEGISKETKKVRTSVYLNCCSTSRTGPLQTKQVNVPYVNSGRTSLVRVTVPLIALSLPIFSVRKSRMPSTRGRL